VQAQNPTPACLRRRDRFALFVLGEVRRDRLHHLARLAATDQVHAIGEQFRLAVVTQVMGDQHRAARYRL
jgi:hypothetical protein